MKHILLRHVIQNLISVMEDLLEVFLILRLSNVFASCILPKSS